MEGLPSERFRVIAPAAPRGNFWVDTFEGINVGWEGEDKGQKGVGEPEEGGFPYEERVDEEEKENRKRGLCSIQKW